MPSFPAVTSRTTIAFGGSYVLVCRCVSHDCKLYMVTVQDDLNRPRYQRGIQETVVVLTLTTML